MRHQSKWNGKVKTDLAVKEYHMRLQWGYYMEWGQPRFIDVSPVVAMTGGYDGWIRRAVGPSLGKRLQYDELATIREFIGKYIERYDSRKGGIEGYLFKLARWSRRHVYARQHNTLVHYPFYLAENCEHLGRTVRIDALVEESEHDGAAWARATTELREIEMESGNSRSPEEEVFIKQIGACIAEVVNGLTRKEREIIEARLWKLIGYKKERHDDLDAFVDIGNAMGVSRERVRQIQMKAIGKLRKRLKPLWDEYTAV